MNNKLFDGSDDEADEVELKTNKDYATTYNTLRKKELLQKYKDRGLDVSESELDSDSSSSEDGEVVDSKFDQEFFKTLASLKSKDPRIYDKETRFFEKTGDDDSDSDDENESTQSNEKKQKKSKPVTLKDYERKVILEHNGKFESSDDEQKDGKEQERAQSPTAVEEERRLKAEFKNVMEQEDESEEEEFGGIFKKRTKTKAQTDAEEADYAQWLAGKDADIDKSAQDQLAPLKQYWSNSKLTQGESFLRDYILNKGYTNTNASEIPTYDEIVGDNAPLSEDEQELEKQAEFEQKYNFRFEEPDTDFIKRYPRTIDQSLRRTDDKRKAKRMELKERKAQEKNQKMKELDLIKDLKRKEIEEKIRKLKAVTGNDELGFKDEELEEDFDPEEHDRRMKELFNDDYYNVDEGEEKPECPSDIEELAIEDWDNYDPKHNQGGSGDNDELHCEDDDFNMDCDYDPAAAKQQMQQELIENTRGRKGRRGRRNRFMEMIQAEKPVFNPEDEKTYAEYIDEYYKLDYEDIVGDQPCRFKYIETTPNDFGLTIEEILLAKNKELNQWASLKKAIQTRPEYVEKKEQRLYKMKAKNEDLKRKIFKSLYGEGSDEEDKPEEENETQSAAQVSASTAEQKDDVVSPTISSTEGMSKSKKKRLRRKAAATSAAGTKVPEIPIEKEVLADQETAKRKVTTDVPAEDKATPIKKQKRLNRKEDKIPKQATPNPFNKTQKPVETVKSGQTQQAANNSDNMAKEANKPATPNPFNKSQKPAKTAKKEQIKRAANNSHNILKQADKPASSNPFNKSQKSTKNTKNGQTKQAANNSNDLPKQADQPPMPNPFNKSQKPGKNEGMKQAANNPFSNPSRHQKPSSDNNLFKKPQSGKSKAAPSRQPFPVRKTSSFKAKDKANNPNGISNDRLKAYGINPRKFHNQQKYGKKSTSKS